jgi:hypothetical protein
MSEFVFHPDAIKDLEEIWEHLAASTPPIASARRFSAQSSLWCRSHMSATVDPTLLRGLSDFKPYATM